ncbi:hypothetical protein [Methanococcoides sp. NM1]|uniref:hypothetical protein n=1 Tax=Methanococcoides sp. NM1 TaxID=1201013 RepID=UPI0014383592|nr:hypothetical protein [Methanococcoides sp. NM1]
MVHLQTKKEHYDDVMGIFIPAFFVTFAHVLFMVWYRRKEDLVSPSISLILGTF